MPEMDVGADSDATATLKFFLSRHIWTYPGLVTGAILFASTSAALAAAIIPAPDNTLQTVPDNASHIWWRIVFVTIVLITWVVVWIYKRHFFERITTGNIGVVIAITSENEAQRLRIEADLSRSLENMLRDSVPDAPYEVLTLQPFHAFRLSHFLLKYAREHTALFVREMRGESNLSSGEQIRFLKVDRKWQRIRKRLRGHFYIYGSIKERKDQKDKYIFNIDALIVHRPIDLPTKKAVQYDLNMVFPRERSFYKDLEFSGFKLTARSLFVATTFITGNAAMLQGDFNLAYKIFSNLKRQLAAHTEEIPENIEYVKTRINTVLAASQLLIARTALLTGKIAEAVEMLEQAYQIDSKNYSVLLQKAYLEFVYNSNPRRTLQYLEKARQAASSDLLWLYNKAFVLMFIGKHKRAIGLYKLLITAKCLGEEMIVDECIKSDEQIAKTHPDKLEIIFVLGVLYQEKKLNLPLGAEYFERFIREAGDREEYRYLCHQAREFLARGNRTMGLH